MANMTTRVHGDGFGSQFNCMISAILSCQTLGNQFYHTPIKSLVLDNDPNPQNQDLVRANAMLDDYISDLGFRNATEEDNCQGLGFYDCGIYANPEAYYTDVNLNFLKSWKRIPKSVFYKQGEFNIAIHIRRGDDVVDPRHLQCRIISFDLYDSIIQNLRKTFPEANIHIFCWGTPELKSEDEKTFFHLVDNGGYFLDHFIAMIQADVLVVGSSSFSFSAGFLNKNVVICDDLIFRLNDMPLPPEWKLNYKKYIENV